MHENGPGSSPLVWDDLMIFHLDGSDKQHVVALYKDSGKIAWKTKRSGELRENPQLQKSYSTPIVETFNGKPVRAAPCKDLSDAVLGTTSPHQFSGGDVDAFMGVAKAVAERKIIYGGDCYNYGLVASGHVDVVIEAGLKLYDFAALVPVVEGAGGVMSDWQGNPLDAGSDGRVIALGDAARLDDVLEAMGGSSAHDHGH